MQHLVTGGAGFLGSHLIDQLMEDDHCQVICVDNFQTGYRNNIAQWLYNPRFKLIRHDVAEPIRLEADQIWHLAWPASPQRYQQNPINTARSCFLGTLNMLELARSCNAKLLFASTSELYDNPLASLQSKTNLGSLKYTNPQACYVEGKRMGETLCFDYARKHNISITVARISNTYGPRMTNAIGRIVASLMTEYLQRKPSAIDGSGVEMCSYCSVYDLTHGLMTLMNSDRQGPINAGNPHAITIAEFADRIRALVNPTLDGIDEPLQADDPERRRSGIESQG